MTKLQYLDLSMAVINTSGLVELFSRCTRLKKLSLEHVPLNDAVCKELANNKQLEVLNLAMCTGITRYGIRKLMISLKWLVVFPNFFVYFEITFGSFLKKKKKQFSQFAVSQHFMDLIRNRGNSRIHEPRQ